MHAAEILVALLVVGVARSAPSPAIITPQDVKDYAAVIPVEKIWEIVSNYLAYDNEVKNVLGYIHTDEFKHMITEIDAIPEFIEFLNSLESSGYEGYKYWNIIHTVLGMAGIKNPNPGASPPPTTGGLSGMVDEISGVIDKDAIKAVYEKKLKANPQFKTLLELFDGDKFQAAVDKMAALPGVKAMLEKMALSDLLEERKACMKKH